MSDMPTEPHYLRKIVSQNQLRERLEAHRQAGDTIVLSNGCFDLIHVGHVRCLQAAAEMGDVLVVGLNSDASVRELKGEGRPYMPANNRAEVLAAMTAVDYVVVFDEPTAAELLRLVTPHIYAKGTDYTRKNVPERNAADEVGAKIAICGDQKTHSVRRMLTLLNKERS